MKNKRLIKNSLETENQTELSLEDQLNNLSSSGDNDLTITEDDLKELSALSGDSPSQKPLDIKPADSPDEPEPDLSSDPDESLEESLNKLKEKKSRRMFKKLQSAQNVHETVRDLVFQDADFDGSAADPEDRVAGVELVKKKRKELYEMLETMDEQMQGKSVKEVSALFTSLLEINNQLCLQKTDGVISIKTRLFQFFAANKSKSSIQPALRQEISLIFSPEEINSIRSRTTDMDEDDPLKPFFTMILDQAYDVVQYSETTGYLLLEMTNYFLNKLKANGYGDTPKAGEFRERHDRAKMSMEKSIEDLRHVEKQIQAHVRERPVLLELPKLLRALIQVKLGMLDKKTVPKIIQQIQSRLGDYARARSAVAFDFNRVPGFQHSIRLRQSIILNLHSDILKYMGEVFEEEFRAVQAELEQFAKEIEAASVDLDPNSPEYEEIMQRKAQIQKRIEEQRRKVDVVKSQQKLVDVQHKMIGEAIQRYNNQESMHKRLDEQLQNRSSVDTNTPGKVEPMKKKKISRMVMAGKRR